MAGNSFSAILVAVLGLFFLLLMCSPVLFVVGLLVLYPLVCAAREAEGWRRCVWLVLLVCDVLLIVMFGIFAVGFLGEMAQR